MAEDKLLSEILEDKAFIQILEDQITKVKTQKLERPPAPPGMKYRRDAIDRMIESGDWRITYFKNNIMDILYKESQLPSEIRNVIQSVFMVAVNIYLNPKPIKEKY